MIVVEVLSPATAEIDHGVKLEGYLSLPSLAHYLAINPVRRVVIPDSRVDGVEATTRILRVDPPGLELNVEDLFEPGTET